MTAVPEVISVWRRGETHKLTTAAEAELSRVRVVFVHGTLEIGGAEEVRLSLLTHLDRRRYEPIVCCLQRGGELAEEISALGCELIVLGYRAHAFSVGALLALRRLLRERRPHIVQTSLPRANYWGRAAAALERTPVIIAEEHSVRERSDRVRPMVEWALGGRTDCVIAVSESVKQAIAGRDDFSARRQTVVIPNPVNAARLIPTRSRSEVRRELRLAENAMLAVHLGRMDRLGGAKGQELLIEAAPAIPDVAFALVGDGPARAQLEGMARGLGVGDRFRFPGFRRDVADFLAAADLFVFPSRIEGMPLALMEAMWMGLPAVASDIPANRETLGDGKYGLLLPSQSAGALARAISALAGDPARRAELGRRARDYARREFSPERYAQRVTELWEGLLAHKLALARGQGGARR